MSFRGRLLNLLIGSVALAILTDAANELVWGGSLAAAAGALLMGLTAYVAIDAIVETDQIVNELKIRSWESFLHAQLLTYALALVLLVLVLVRPGVSEATDLIPFVLVMTVLAVIEGSFWGSYWLSHRAFTDAANQDLQSEIQGTAKSVGSYALLAFGAGLQYGYLAYSLLGHGPLHTEEPVGFPVVAWALVTGVLNLSGAMIARPAKLATAVVHIALAIVLTLLFFLLAHRYHTGTVEVALLACMVFTAELGWWNRTEALMSMKSATHGWPKLLGALALGVTFLVYEDRAERQRVEADGLVSMRAQLGGRLDLYAFEEYVSDSLLAEFKSRYGVEVVVSTFPSNEDMLAKLENGGVADLDLVIASEFAVMRLARAGLLDTIGVDSLPNWANVDPLFKGLAFDSTNALSVPYLWGVSGIAYRRDLRPELALPDRQTWGLLFGSDRQPLRFALLDDRREALGAALIAAGFSVNSGVASQLALAEQTTRSAVGRSQAVLSASGVRDALLSGDVEVAQGYSGDFMLARKENKNLQFFVPREGGVIYLDSFVLLKGSKQRAAALAFLNFMMGRHAAGVSANALGYGSPNTGVDALDPEIAREHQKYLTDEWRPRLQRVLFLGDSLESAYSAAWRRAKAR